MTNITTPLKPQLVIKKSSWKSKAWDRIKTIIVTAMVFAIAILGLLYRMEKTARTMERNEYRRQNQELQEKINKTSERLETSVLTHGSQPSSK